MRLLETSEAYNNTKTLLNLVTNHLQSREECRKCTYYLNITPISTDSNIDSYGITFKVFTDYAILNPYVFPDKYHRNQYDKCPLLHHIFSFYHLNLAENLYGKTGVTVSHISYIPGTYEFKLIGKRRQWTKIR